MKKLLVMLGFAISCSSAMENPKQIIDCNGERFTLTPEQKKILNNNCATTSDYITDPQMRRKSTIHFEGGPSYLDKKNLIRLLSYMGSANTAPKNSPKNTCKRQKKMLALIAAAEYLQAPKQLLRELWIRGDGTFNAPHLKRYEPEFNALGDKLFSLGEYINEYYEIKNYTKKNPEHQQYNPILSGKDTFRIHSLQGLSVLCDIVECARLQRLILSGEKFADFNLNEFIRLMPHLKYLDLGNNKIRMLKKQHLEGMPQNFYLSLRGNPIMHIEEDCLTHEIIRRASGSTISLYDTQLKSEQCEKLEQRWALHTDDATFAVFFTHLLAAGFGTGCIGIVPVFLRDLDHVQKCRQLDLIDVSVIISAALLFTCYLMYCFSLDAKKNNNYIPQFIAFQTNAKNYVCYNDSFARHFWEYFKYTLPFTKNN